MEKEYRQLMLTQQFDPGTLDYSLLERHILRLSEIRELQDIAVSIYDNNRLEHVYLSDYHRMLFGENELEIHPDDFDDVMKNAIATVNHVFQGNRNIMHIKAIREYRVKIGLKYRRVTESMRVLETDSAGNIWLVISLLEISPNQSPPFSVNARIVNTLSGESFAPLTKFYQEKSVLTPREVEVLGYIARGKISKEISCELDISINTVNTIRQHILDKLNVDNSYEAVRYGQSLGLIEY